MRSARTVALPNELTWLARYCMYQKVSLRTPFLTCPAGKLPGRRRVDVDRHGLVGLIQHTRERVSRHCARRVVRELGIELGLEVGGKLAARASLGDGVVDLRDDDVEVDLTVFRRHRDIGVRSAPSNVRVRSAPSNVRVRSAPSNVRVRSAHPVTFTFTGSATVPVVFSGFITSNQCRCSLQS